VSDAFPMHESQFRFTSKHAAEQLGRCIRRGLEKAKAAVASDRGGQRSAPRERDDLAERLAANGVLR
jgi:hypothetical protein